MKRIINRSKANRRAKKITDLARTAFWSAVYACQTVSHFNTGLAFVIRRVGAFGFPEIEVVERPSDVIMRESVDCIVVKDGYYYELDKRQ